MPTSSQRTTVAVLRAILAIKPQELADMVGCSVHTIRSLELGRLRLSDELATRIVHETGVSFFWLRDGNVSAPPLAGPGDEKFSRETFLRRQATKHVREQPPDVWVSMEAIGFYGQLRAILENAHHASQSHLASYKLRRAINELRDEFGQNLDLYPTAASSDPDNYRSRALFSADVQLCDAYSEMFRTDTKCDLPAWQRLHAEALAQELERRPSGPAVRSRNSGRRPPKKKSADAGKG